MDPPTAHSWICPLCERRVPTREPVCHCGFDRRNAPPRERADPRKPPAGAVVTRRRAALATGLLATLFGFLVYAGVTARERSLYREATARTENGRSYPPLPAVAEEEPASDEIGPSTSTRPAFRR